MVLNSGTGEMVIDGGGQFIPAGIDGFHALSLLLAFLVAHGRATEDTHTRTGKKRLQEKEENKTTWVQYIILDRKVLTPSPCE